MARQLYQLSDVQAGFEARIRRKVQDRREQSQDKAGDVPLIGWLMRPLNGLTFDVREGRNTRRGEQGEDEVLRTLLRWLPEHWVVFHSVVVEPEPDIFAQIDLLLVSTAGLFLVETKAWRGSYKAYRDSWQQRQGDYWTKVDKSPTEQVQRQARMLGSWLERQRSFALPATFKGYITPLVVFTEPQWLKVTQCSVEVFKGTRSLIDFLQARFVDVLTVPQVETICDFIIRSPTPVLLPPSAAPAVTAVPQAARPAPSTAAPPSTPPAATPVEIESNTLIPAATLAAPSCPKCGVAMVLRTARQGSNAGNRFYGCPNFPRCRSILAFLPDKPQR